MTSNARSAVVFFDDFQQFTNGTDLTQTNYVPATGVSAEMATNSEELAMATVVASNFLGSTRAFFQLGSLPYLNDYQGEPNGGPLINPEVQLSFQLWIEQTKNANRIGGFVVDLLSSDIDSINGSETNFSALPLIVFNDGGQVWVFTNEPGESDLVPVEIGSWESLEGTVMTNLLSINYPAGTFSFSINGVALTNDMPLPSFLTNVFDRVRLELFEAFEEPGQESQGNRFALDDVQLTVATVLTNADVDSYLAAAKGQLFEQIDAFTVNPAPTGFVFETDVAGVLSNSILSASNQIPGGAIVVLAKASPQDTEFSFSDSFTTKADLDTNYPSGTYTLSIHTLNEDLLTAALNLPDDDYPVNAPQFLNYDAMQTIQSAADFVVQWTNFVGGTTNELISFKVEDDTGNDVFSSPDDQDGTATSALIPAGTLQAGEIYVASLVFARLSSRDTNSIPGAEGETGFFKLTTANMTTLGSTNFVDLVLAKTVSPDPAMVGSSLAYTVTVQNVGTTFATGVTITDALPATVTFVSAEASQGSCTQILGDVICDLGVVTNGDTAGIAVVVTPTAAGSITNVASVSLLETDVNPADNTATVVTTVTPALPDLTIGLENIANSCTNKGKKTICTTMGDLTWLNSGSAYGAGTLGITLSCSGTGTVAKCKLSGLVNLTSFESGDAPVSLFGMYLSEDGLLSEDDVRLMKKELSTTAFEAAFAKGKAVKLKAKAPKGTILSGKFLLLVIDTTNAVPESVENNNATAVGPLP